MNSQPMHIMAYTPPTNGHLKIAGIRYEMGQDFRTLERYQEYRDCGFDVLMQAGETAYKGEAFETSDLKYMMDLAEKTDLRFLVFDRRILDVADHNTYGKKDLICGRFHTKAELQDYLLSCMKPYMEHPAFYGVILGDEPTCASAYNLGNVCEALKAIKPDIYIHNCFLPAVSKQEYATEKFFPNENLSAEKAFKKYIQTMIGTGIGVFDFDAYPFGMWKGKPAFNKNYFRDLQIAAETTKECNTDLYFTIQTFSSGRYDEYRKVDRTDIMYQVNLALSFAVKQIAYFTYWRFQSRGEYDFTSAIMNDDGSKILYDEVRDANAYIQKLYPYIKDCQYAKTQLVYQGRKPRAFTNAKSKNISFFKSIKASDIALVNELTDGQKHIYMVFNATDTFEKKSNDMELILRDKVSSVKALVSGEETELPVVDGKISVQLSPGEGIWILD